MSPAEPPIVGIELVDEETIVERGTRRVVWFVKRKDAWEHASTWPGATSTEREQGPGTVWEREMALQVPAGTELMRVETRPAPPRQRDALEYLRAEVRNTPRQIRRTYFRVDPRGSLTRAPS